MRVAAKIRLFDESGDGYAPIPRASQEGLEFFPDDLMKKGLFGLVAFVFDTRASAGTRTRDDRGKRDADLGKRHGANYRSRFRGS